jgi:hypothetical protein
VTANKIARKYSVDETEAERVIDKLLKGRNSKIYSIRMRRYFFLFSFCNRGFSLSEGEVVLAEVYRGEKKRVNKKSP